MFTLKKKELPVEHVVDFSNVPDDYKLVNSASRGDSNAFLLRSFKIKKSIYENNWLVKSFLYSLKENFHFSVLPDQYRFVYGSLLKAEINEECATFIVATLKRTFTFNISIDATASYMGVKKDYVKQHFDILSKTSLNKNICLLYKDVPDKDYIFNSMYFFTAENTFLLKEEAEKIVTSHYDNSVLGSSYNPTLLDKFRKNHIFDYDSTISKHI